MGGIKELMGLFFMIDSSRLSIMKAAAEGLPAISPQKKLILQLLLEEYQHTATSDQVAQPGAGPRLETADSPETWGLLTNLFAVFVLIVQHDIALLVIEEVATINLAVFVLNFFLNFAISDLIFPIDPI